MFGPLILTFLNFKALNMPRNINYFKILTLGFMQEFYIKISNLAFFESSAHPGQKKGVMQLSYAPTVISQAMSLIYIECTVMCVLEFTPSK